MGSVRSNVRPVILELNSSTMRINKIQINHRLHLIANIVLRGEKTRKYDLIIQTKQVW